MGRRRSSAPTSEISERAYPLRTLAESPAVELFRQRAEAFDPDFDAPYELLAEIAGRLDRLPLALELAAARARVLPPRGLLARLHQRCRYSPAADATCPSQRRLHSTIAWSYELLNADEQRIFCRLAVFSGGSTVAAAGAVCDADLDTLESLVDKSLVRRDGERFAMLETIREYGLEQLERLGESAEVRRAHARFFSAFADACELRGEVPGPGMQWLDSLLKRAPNAPLALRAHALRALGGAANPAGRDEGASRSRSASSVRSSTPKGGANRACPDGAERRSRGREGLRLVAGRDARQARRALARARLARRGRTLRPGSCRASRDLGDRLRVVRGLARLARIAAERGDHRSAGRLWGAVEAEEARGPIGAWENEREAYVRTVLAATASEFERARDEGRKLSLDEALDVALSDA